MPLTTTTTADTTIPELWSAITADQREENIIIFNMFDRRYEEEARGKPYDIIHIQGISNYATGAVTLGVGGTLSSEAMVFATQINLTINTHIYHLIDIEYEAELMSNISLMEKGAGKSGYAMALSMDDTLAGLVDDFSTNALGQLAVGLDEDDVRTAARMLDDAIAPTDNRFLVVAPIQLRNLQGQEAFRNSLYKEAVGTLSANAATRQYHGKIYGAGLYATGNVEGSNAAGHDNGMWHKESVAVAVIDNMRVRSFYEITTDSDQRAVHAIYGQVEVRDDHGVFMRGL